MRVMGMTWSQGTQALVVVALLLMLTAWGSQAPSASGRCTLSLRRPPARAPAPAGGLRPRQQPCRHHWLGLTQQPLAWTRWVPAGKMARLLAAGRACLLTVACMVAAGQAPSPCFLGHAGWREASAPVPVSLTSYACGVLCRAVACPVVSCSVLQEMSEAEVWQQHHSQVQQHQLEYERKAQLTKAVHAAIAYGKQLGYRPFSPTNPTHHDQHTAQQQQAGQQQVTLPTHQEQQDQQQQHNLSVVSSQDDASQAGQQQEPQQPSASLCQWQGVGSASTDGLGSSNSSNSSSHTTRSSGSTRGSYSDLAEEEAADAGAAGALQPGAVPAAAAAALQEAAAGAAAKEAGQGCLEGAVGATAAAEQQCDEGCEERWRAAPVWGVSDYEEEVAQLSDQLQVRGPWGSACSACVAGRSCNNPLWKQGGHEGRG